MTDKQLVHGSGHADIAETALLFQAVRIIGRQTVGEETLLDADQEDDREFQALGAMQGHELDAILELIGLGIPGLQGRVGQEGGQGVALAFHLAVTQIQAEAPGGLDQLPQVLDAILPLAVLLLAVVLLQARGGNQVVGQALQVEIRGRAAVAIDKTQELADGPSGAGGQGVGGHEVPRGSPEGDPRLPGLFPQVFQGAGADAAHGGVDGTLEGGVVVGVGDQAQVGHGVLDLGALEEAQTTINPIEDLGIDQGLLEEPRLGRGAIEDGALGAAVALVRHIAANAIGHEAGLVHLVKGGVAQYEFALGVLGPEVLAQSVRILGDQGVGGLEDGAGGAIILLQAYYLGVGVVALEALDVLHPRPTPAIDGLIVVAHQEEIVPVPGQQAQPGVLDGIGILELVHQDVGEALLVVVADVRAVPQQFMGAQQQIGEINLAGVLAGRLVLAIDLDALALVEIAAIVQVLRPAALVLFPVDEAHDLAGGVA